LDIEAALTFKNPQANHKLLSNDARTKKSEYDATAGDVEMHQERLTIITREAISTRIN